VTSGGLKVEFMSSADPVFDSVREVHH
jgi:hypothetical protein